MPPLSTQALVLLICNFVIFVLLFASILIPRSRDQPKQNDAKVARIILLFVIILPLMVLSIYALNCMIVGQCTGFAWSLSAIAILIAILYIIGFIMAILKKKKQRV